MNTQVEMTLSSNTLSNGTSNQSMILVIKEIPWHSQKQLVNSNVIINNAFLSLWRLLMIRECFKKWLELTCLKINSYKHNSPSSFHPTILNYQLTPPLQIEYFKLISRISLWEILRMPLKECQILPPRLLKKNKQRPSILEQTSNHL